MRDVVQQTAKETVNLLAPAQPGIQLLTKSVIGIVLQHLERQTEAAQQASLDSAAILARAEAERKRISDKYTRQRAQAKEMLEDFKRVRVRAELCSPTDAPVC